MIRLYKESASETEGLCQQFPAPDFCNYTAASMTDTSARNSARALPFTGLVAPGTLISGRLISGHLISGLVLSGLVISGFLLSSGAMAQQAAPQSTLQASPTAPPAATPPSADRQALEARLSALTTALAGDVCAEPEKARALLAAGGPSARSGGDPGNPVASSPSALSSSGTPSSGTSVTPSTTPLGKSDLAHLLKTAVVLIVAGENSGSGFVVDGQHIVTNNHVVSDAKNGEVIIAGAGIGGPRTAQVIAKVEDSGPAGRDFALLKVGGAPLTATMTLSPAIDDLQPIIAAGFPGLLVENDVQFHRLMQGDLSATPEIILSQGSVMAIQNRSTGIPTIAHNAPISGGNSGGPLVDSCGRVVGINTYIRVSTDQGTNAGYALGTEGILKFLNKHGVSVKTQSSACKG